MGKWSLSETIKSNTQSDNGTMSNLKGQQITLDLFKCLIVINIIYNCSINIKNMDLADVPVLFSPVDDDYYKAWLVH